MENATSFQSRVFCFYCPELRSSNQFVDHITLNWMRFVLIQFLELMMSSQCCDDNKLVIASFQEMCV